MEAPPGAQGPELQGIDVPYLLCNVRPLDGKYDGSTICDSKGHTVATTRQPGNFQWINMLTCEGGTLPDDFRSLASETEYFANQRAACYRRNIFGETEKKPVIRNHIVDGYHVSDYDTVGRMVERTGNLFYLPYTGTFASEFVLGGSCDLRQTMLAAGGISNKAVVNQANVISPVLIRQREFSTSQEYANYIILYSRGRQEIIFANKTCINVDTAAKFDEESVIYAKDGNIYYYHCTQQAPVKIEWPADINLWSIAVCGSKIVFNRRDSNHMFVGDIERRQLADTAAACTH